MLYQICLLPVILNSHAVVTKSEILLQTQHRHYYYPNQVQVAISALKISNHIVGRKKNYLFISKLPKFFDFNKL